MAGNGVPLIARDRIIGHAGKIIVGIIVLAHVIDTETPIFPLTQPAFGRTMVRVLVTAGPFAGRAVGAHAPVGDGLDADAIEQRRVEFHDRSLCEI